MKRDCGEGELRPCSFVVITCNGASDDEDEFTFPTLELALAKFNEELAFVEATERADVRLYAKDRQGYMNCVKGAIHRVGGEIYRNDRTHLL